MPKSLLQKVVFWKFLSNFWALVALIIFVADFIYQHQFSTAAGACAIIYMGALSIYVGTKEYERWKEYHKSVFRGETFVIIWTVIVLIMLITTFATRGTYNISGVTMEVYIAVLALFAVTQRSKSLYKRKSSKSK